MEALSIKHYKHAFNAKLLTAERLESFHAQPTRQGPRLHRTMLDVTAMKPSDNLKSRWNKALINLLCLHCARIVTMSSNSKKFGSDFSTYENWEAWAQPVRSRIYEVFRVYCSGYPRPGESVTDVENRIQEEWLAQLAAKGMD